MIDVPPEWSLNSALSIAPSPDFASDGTCFAIRGSRLYRTLDGGRTWEFALSSLRSPDVACVSVAVSPHFSRDRMVSAGVVGGLVSSHDGGETWIEQPFGPPAPVVSTLGISPDYFVDGVIVVGTFEDGVLRSADHSHTWAAANSGLLDMSVLSMAISPTFHVDGVAIVGTTCGVFRSTNGARFWADLDFPPAVGPVLSVGLSQVGTLFAGTESHGLFRSTDNGQSWKQIGSGVISTEVDEIIVYDTRSSQHYAAVLHDGTISATSDCGETWTEHPSVHGIVGQVATFAVVDTSMPSSSLIVGLSTGEILHI